MLNTIETYYMLFLIYSVLGWTMETTLGVFENKKFVNRGFLIGPYCPIYGAGVLLITVLLEKYSDDIALTFILSILICGVLEYYTSYFMEKIFKARWWDYSNKRFNINGRICLETIIPFGIMGGLIIYIANPFFIGVLNKLPEIVLRCLAGGILAVQLTDITFSLKIILNLKRVSKTFKDNTEEISQKVRSIIKNRKNLHIRVFNAFPLLDKKLEIKARVMKEYDKVKKATNDIKEKVNKSIKDRKNEQ